MEPPEEFFMIVVYRVKDDPRQYHIEQRSNAARWIIESYQNLARTLAKDPHTDGFLAILFRNDDIILEQVKEIEVLDFDQIPQNDKAFQPGRH